MTRAWGGTTKAVPAGKRCASRVTCVLCAKKTPPSAEAVPWSKPRASQSHVPSGPA
jgi:hypothetical protein